MFKFSAFWLALAAAFFWGVSPLLGKAGLSRVEVLTGLAVRNFAVSTVLLIIILCLGRGKQLIQLDMRSAVFLACEGLLASLIGHFFYYTALKHGQVSIVSPVVSIFPLFAFFGAVLLFSEKLTWTKGTGLILVILGIILLRL